MSSTTTNKKRRGKKEWMKGEEPTKKQKHFVDIKMWWRKQDMEFSKINHEFVTINPQTVRYAHHCEFLTQYLSHKVVPKGMHIYLKINAPGKPSSSFQNRLLGIQKKASFDSMWLLLSRNQSILRQIDTSLKNTELEYQTNSDIADGVFAEAN